MKKPEKITAGDWFVLNCYRTPHSSKSDTDFVITAEREGSDYAIATVHKRGHPEDYYNAHLMSAAPELADALHECLARLVEYADHDSVANGYGWGVYSDPHGEVEPVVTKAKAALLKAGYREEA